MTDNSAQSDAGAATARTAEALGNYYETGQPTEARNAFLEAHCADLANQLRQARAALAQSDEEPVAWQVRSKGSPDWYIWQRDGNPSDNIDPEYYEARPLYTAPPRPDVSGLIEAAEWLRDQTRYELLSEEDRNRVLETYNSFCNGFGLDPDNPCSRAADRSRK